MISKRLQKGITLPVVIVFSVTVLSVMTALLSVAHNSYKGIYVDHYQKMAEEAAEAGAAYATACLNLSAHTQTWGPAAGASNLAPNSDCAGANAYPTNLYVHNDSKARTYFTVGNLDYTVQFAAQVSSQGYTQVLNPDGSVRKTYTSIIKKMITWSTDVGVQMSVSGTRRTCAIVNSALYCWGGNKFGQLGDGRYIGGTSAELENWSAIDSTVPVKVRQDPGVLAGKKIVKVFVAQYHTCALSDDGLMYCWGYNEWGGLGTGTITDSPVAVQVQGALAGKVITDIGGTNDVSCAIAEDKIYCWGTNTNGLTGRGLNSGTTLTPTLVSASNTGTTLPTNYTATALSTSGSRARLMCAVVSGKAYCWGQNNAGSVGDNTTTQRTVPTKVIDSGVLSGKTVTAISQDGYADSTNGYSHACALASGALYCWGHNNAGQVGDDTLTNKLQPVAVVASGVLSGKTIQDVKVGLRHSCARANSGVYCWGTNASGHLGDGTNITSKVPVAVSQSATGVTSSNVISIGAGSNRGCAVIADGRTFCWGVNSDGQIGDGTKIDRNVPTESLFLRPVGNQYLF